ncbi:LicD family protein [Butyrivibrio fibrisolvens]|uniref:LicD family protein n=1 Tax=Butyrivibrio fibrisolvens TaxID=831 RepID=UPI0003B77E78|nr:LicD family protein [Butyrivibrio fibrisolvens]
MGRKSIVAYNCLSLIVEKISNIFKRTPDTELVFAGNSRFVPLMNAVLSSNDTQINRVIDNDTQKQGKRIEEAFPSLYFERLLKEHNKEIIIERPESVVNSKKQSFIILSINADEIRNQLIGLGANPDSIYTFSKRGREMLKDMAAKDQIFDDSKRVDLREMQIIELGVLMEFHRFCVEHNLTYYLSSGSLIGAIRHKGFIPWDDDVDVYMPYEDYCKFMEIYPDDGVYKAVDWTKDNDYFLAFGKLYDSRTTLLHAGFPVNGIMGIYIDIFPLAGYKNDEDPQIFWDRNVELEQEWSDYYAARTLLGDSIPDIRQDIINERYCVSVKDAKFVGARHWLPHIKQWCVRKEIYDGVEIVDFEGEKVFAPKGWHELLSERYGDYMKLPPKEKQEAHFFEAYRK